jgi:hypothetical protein
MDFSQSVRWRVDRRKSAKSAAMNDEKTLAVGCFAAEYADPRSDWESAA